MSFVNSEVCVGATCLNGGVSTMRGKVILQKWLNGAISHIHGRHAAPVINLNQFIAHHWLPLFYFKFCNQIKVKEAKDERRRGKETRRGERRAGRGKQDKESFRAGFEGGEQNRTLTLRDWRAEHYLFRWTEKENGLVFWVYKNWEYCLLRFFSLFMIMYWYCF